MLCRTQPNHASTSQGASLDSESQPTLVLNMFDSDTFSSEEMGRVTVHLKDIDQTGTVVDKWYKLENTEKATNITGEIHLRFQYSRGLPTSLPIDINTPPKDVTEDNPEEVSRSIANVASLTEDDVKLKECPSRELENAIDTVLEGKGPNEIHVVVVKAKGLLAMDKSMMENIKSIKLPSIGFGKKKKSKGEMKDDKKGGKAGTSDPFVQVYTTSTTGKVSCKTEVIKKTTEPVWETNNNFKIAEADEGADLIFEIRDDDLVSSEFMGKVVIPMKTFASRAEIREWYTIKNKDNENDTDTDRGYLLVAVKWIYNPAILSEAEAIDPSDMGPPMDIAPDIDVKPANRVNIFVLRARNIPVMDKNMFSSGGSSDPVVKLSYDKEKHKTKVVKKNLYPVFMERFFFDRVLSTTSKNTIEVTVEDYDLTGNDFIGRVKIPLISLKDRTEVRHWFKLGNKEGKTDGKDRGELLLAVRWTYDPKAKPPKAAGGGLDDLNDAKPKRKITTVPKRKITKAKKVEPVVVLPPEPRLLENYGNWGEYQDMETKQIYWYNNVSRVSTWEMPGFVKDEKRKRMIRSIKEHTEKALQACDKSAYFNFKQLIKDERDRAFKTLSNIAKKALHEDKMRRFMVFLLHQELKELGAALRPWKELLVRQEDHEVEAAALEVQRVVRSFLERRRHSATERGIAIHYVRLKVNKMSLEHKEKMETIERGDGFALVGEMALENAEEEVLDGIYASMLDIVAEEIAREMEVYEQEAERLR